MRIHGARRGFRVVLHREDGPALDANPAIRAVEERDVSLLHALRQRLAVDREAVIHRYDLDLAGFQVLDRMIGAVMALRHLSGLAAEREPQHLMAKADAED